MKSHPRSRRRTPPKPRPPLAPLPLSLPLSPPHPLPLSPPSLPPPPDQQPTTDNQHPLPLPSAADLARIVEDACRFILERKQTHAASIAWEIGEYLFERVYRGDLAYLERDDPTKTDSLGDIAAGSGLSRVRLASWIRAYVARKYLRPAGIDVDLSMSDFEALRPLVLHPEAARAVLDLRARHRLSTQQLDVLAVAWKRRLDEGGRLEDLVAAPLPHSISPRPKPTHSPRPLPDRDLVPIRLLRIVLRWLRSVTLAPALRASLLRAASSLRSQVSSSPSPPEPTTNSQEPTTLPPLPPLPPEPTTNDQEPVTPPLSPPVLVAAAVRFIRSCVRRHGLRFALEVGQYLFLHVYGGNRAAFRNGGAKWQRETIQRIARDRRVRLDDSFLYKSIHVFLLVGLVADAVPPAQLPELPLTTWNELWPLEEHPEAVVAVGAWAAAERVPARTVAVVASLVAPYLAHGGSLDDLLAGGHRTPPDTPYRRIQRLLSVVRTRLAAGPVSPAARPQLLGALDNVLSALA
ncbi:MAG: hypothetical protein HY905_23340 [Deltaproteobacteria bacterium]|nr:hypothetical protein [Deltaproteobacteria bacterium]